MRRLGAIAGLFVGDHAAGDEFGSHRDGRVQVAAAVVAQIEDQAFRILSQKCSQLAVQIARRAIAKGGNLDVGNIIVQHLARDARDDNLCAGDFNVKRIVLTRALDGQLDGRPRRPKHFLPDRFQDPGWLHPGHPQQ